jgi:hypothetical protein
MATLCVPQVDFSSQAGTTAGFDGGALTSDAGLLLLRAFDRRFRLTDDLVGAYQDLRRADRVEHTAPALLRQRLYQIVAGYEDADDSDLLRRDPVLQTVVGRRDLSAPLGSQPTMSPRPPDRPGSPCRSGGRLLFLLGPSTPFQLASCPMEAHL